MTRRISLYLRLYQGWMGVRHTQPTVDVFTYSVMTSTIE